MSDLGLTFAYFGLILSRAGGEIHNPVAYYGLLIMYTILVLGGVGWLGFKLTQYLRAEKEREAGSNQLMNDQEFKKYLGMLKKQQAEKKRRAATGERSSADGPRPQQTRQKQHPEKRRRPATGTGTRTRPSPGPSSSRRPR